MPNPRLRFLFASCLATWLTAGEIPPAGLRLDSFYTSMEVERHWLKGRHIDWRTGDPDTGKIGKTHCSAFVAAACERLHIELLRPPEHSQKNLANAQYRWLADEGTRFGWAEVVSPWEAQRLANDGQVVVVVYQNPDPRTSGHIALVRPSGKEAAAIRAEGPQIIQAGGTNYASTSVKIGFRRHQGAWTSLEDHRLRFYSHPVPQ